MPAMYQLLAQECNSEALAIFAYAVYKRHKAESLKAILDKNGAPATVEELEAFYISCSTPCMREMYVQQAEALMQRVLDNTLTLRRRGLDQMLAEFGRNSGVLQK